MPSNKLIGLMAGLVVTGVVVVPPFNGLVPVEVVGAVVVVLVGRVVNIFYWDLYIHWGFVY